LTQPPTTDAPAGLPPELDPRRGGKEVQRPPGRGRRAARVLSWIAVAVSMSVLVASTVLYVGFRYYNSRITRIETRIPGHTAPPAEADGPAQNFLIVGSDTREGAGNSSFGAKKGSAKYVAGQRSDTVMLVHIPSGDAKATIVSFPRDSWVDIPAFTDGRTGTHYPKHHNRINTAFSIGGPPLLIETVERLSKLRVDHYVQVDFAGFQRMVNALGGVTICVKTNRRDRDAHINLTAGTHHVNGKTALAFVRQRKGLPRGDLDRIVDQQYFLSVLLHKVLSAGTLANPLKINAFLHAATAAVTVDRQLSLNDMRTLALRMRRLDPAHVRLLTAPVANASARVNGASVVLLDDAKMRTLFTSLKRDQNPAKTTPPARPNNLTVAPRDITVSVYNGAGSPGLARRVAADLRSVGFATGRVGNRGTGATGTVVRYGPSRAESARTVAAAVPGATLQLDASLGNRVELVAGSNYSGARRVALGRAPRPSAPATAGGSNAAAAAKGCAP
jgi:LCP family protein required for cell wall assembly